MRVYAILLLFIYKILANAAEVFNVGTVLFSPDEVKKDDWSVTDVSLLKARRYLQYVLPHPFLVDPSIDHFADVIIDYFTNAVSVVKRAEKDPVSTNILTAALFDAIGGYMKSYVLPVTKYGYYGGTVSKDDAQKLYQFYDDIKSYLKTDGSGWRSFDGKFQKPLKIIATYPRDYVRATRESCNQLAFYEETSSGFTIPLPSINFDSQSPTMFVPLKGSNSLISLHSPGSTDALLNYYHAANNCLKARRPNDAAEFDNRFRAWLTDNVLGHLDDDIQLYYALGGILTLATDQKDTECSLTSLSSSPIPSRKQYIHINFSSKKVMILAVILFLEVVWCIPTLCYMLYKRRRKNKEIRDMLLFVNPNKDKDDQFLSSSDIQVRSSGTTSGDENTGSSVRKYKKKYFRIDDTGHVQNPSSQHFASQTSDIMLSKCSRGTSNRSCFCSEQCSTGSSNEIKIENERPVKKPMRSALKHTSAPVFDVKSSSFSKPRLFESYNQIKIKGKRSSQNVGVKYMDEDNLEDNITYMTKDRKSKENIFSKSIESANNNRQSSNGKAVIQIESYNNMDSQRFSNKSIIKQPTLNETSDLCKSSIDNLTQGISNNVSAVLRHSKDKVNISHEESKEELTLRGPGNRTVIAQNIQDETINLKRHENTTLRKSKEKQLRSHKSLHNHDNSINVRHSQGNAVVFRKSDGDARTQLKVNQDLILAKSKHHLVIQNKSQDDLNKDGKFDDTTMTAQKLKNEVTIGTFNYGEEQLHMYRNDDAVPDNDVTTSLRQVVEKVNNFAESNNALMIIENLDQNAKNLQKSTNELMQLIDERRGTCGDPICECTCCQSLKDTKSYSETQTLKTCATITLIPDDDSSQKSFQSMISLYRENQEIEINLAADASRPMINTSVVTTNQTKSRTNSISSSLNPKLKSSILSTADARSSAKEEIKDLSRNTEKDERSDAKEENKDSKKVQKKKVEKKIEEKVKKKVEKKVEKKEGKTKRNFGFKFTTCNKALFEVSIEKPQANISVGITRGNLNRPKTSRIPTRIVRDNFVRFDDRVSAFQSRPLEAPVRTKIPMPVKKATDDIVIRHSRNKATASDPRLNVTL